ncbi:protein hairy [Anopheles cruzii]|uniref:protein hairy n=1 Tax=Anopheles cruzii TaxID=68878 RepID=UPI0022EC8B1A|nr:protein hairy [Anopheles cruzii]
MVTGIGATTQQVAGAPATIQNLPAEPVKRSSDNRRSNKPIMEKRRRARINNCLNELKALILDAMKKDPARHSKLEKADILEMTVKHLENLQRQQSALSQASDPSVMNKFKAGFNECAQEVGRFPEIEPLVKRRLMQHLSNCINSNGVKDLPKRHHHHQHQQAGSQAPLHILPSPPSSPEQPGGGGGVDHHAHHFAASQYQQHPHHLQGANGSVYMTSGVGGASIQLIPTKLPNGSVAFVLPQAAAAASVAPVPMLVPIPTRTASTGSASSSQSGVSSLYDRVPREHATSPYHAPPSPANSNYEPMECSQSVATSQLSPGRPAHQYYLQQPSPAQQQQPTQQPTQQPATQSQQPPVVISSSSPDSPLSLVMKKPYQDEDRTDDDDDDDSEDDQDMKQAMEADDDGKSCWRPW